MTNLFLHKTLIANNECDKTGNSKFHSPLCRSKFNWQFGTKTLDGVTTNYANFVTSCVQCGGDGSRDDNDERTVCDGSSFT